MKSLAHRVVQRFAGNLRSWKTVNDLARRFYGYLDKSYHTRSPAAQDTRWVFHTYDGYQDFVREMQQSYMTFRADSENLSVIVWF